MAAQFHAGAPNLSIAIIGGSLTGLSLANTLSAHTVHVYEHSSTPLTLRGGALGAVDVDLLHQICPKTYKHQVAGHGHFYGDLWGYLYAGLKPGQVTFGANVTGLEDAGTERPRVAFNGGVSEPYDLIVGCDGGKSIVRQYVTDQMPTYSGYTVWRGLCRANDIEGPPSGRRQVRGVIYETLGFPVSVPRGYMGTEEGVLWNCGIYMAMPESMVERPVRNRQVGAATIEVPEWFHEMISALFDRRTASFWRNCAAKGKVTPHAVWELACKRVVKGRIALAGDAAHMASPRTGAGAYTGMRDAVAFKLALEGGGGLESALEMYNTDVVERGEALFQRSRAAASSFAPGEPGDVRMKPQEVVAYLKAKGGGREL